MLFDETAREEARRTLPEDIAQLISECGDAMPVNEFYLAAYNCTQAHSEDIHTAIMQSENVEVLIKTRNKRRSALTISRDDTLALKRQMMFDISRPRHTNHNAAVPGVQAK